MHCYSRTTVPNSHACRLFSITGGKGEGDTKKRKLILAATTNEEMAKWKTAFVDANNIMQSDLGLTSLTSQLQQRYIILCRHVILCCVRTTNMRWPTHGHTSQAQQF